MSNEVERDLGFYRDRAIRLERDNQQLRRALNEAHIAAASVLTEAQKYSKRIDELEKEIERLKREQPSE